MINGHPELQKNYFVKPLLTTICIIWENVMAQSLKVQNIYQKKHALMY